jgi:CRP-like cAMP-binding protein
MADTLLQELSNADLDWIITSGQRQELRQGQELLNLKQQQELIYILIDGRFSLDLSLSLAGGQPLAIDELAQGEVLGIGALLDMTETGVVNALETALVMALPVAQVKQKLINDIDFAAHFYRAIAVMLSTRLRRIFEHPERIQFWGERSAKEALSVFGELRDSDVDWLVSFGETETIPSGQVLLQAGRPVEALYILLDGQMAISAPQQGTFNPLYLCFSGLEESTRDQKAFATLSQGGMPGIISFLDFRPLPVTIRTVQESLVFAVPRQTLATKLQVDNSFASRFYRVVAIEVLTLLQHVSSRLLQPEAPGPGFEDVLEEELDLADLQQMSEGAKKFNWMLAQLGVSHDG